MINYCQEHKFKTLAQLRGKVTIMWEEYVSKNYTGQLVERANLNPMS